MTAQIQVLWATPQGISGGPWPDDRQPTKQVRGVHSKSERYHPSDLLCWLTVIWSGAPTDSFGRGPHTPLWLAVLADGHLVRGPHWFLGGRPTVWWNIKERLIFICLLLPSVLSLFDCSSFFKNKISFLRLTCPLANMFCHFDSKSSQSLENLLKRKK